VHLVKPNTTAVLRHVVELTCDTSYSSFDNVTSFLSPSTFPSLRNLAYYQDLEDDTACEVNAQLLEQLDVVVFLDPDVVVDAPDLSALPSSCLLFGNTDLDYLRGRHDTLPRFVHYCLRNLVTQSPTTQRITSGLNTLAGTLRSSPPSTFRLTRLSLPTGLRTSTTSLLVAAVEGVMEACANRDVEVVFEDGEDKLGGSFLPLSTIEYAKKLRAEQEEQKKGREKDDVADV
jgi:hypothetical protein